MGKNKSVHDRRANECQLDVLISMGDCLTKQARVHVVQQRLSKHNVLNNLLHVCVNKRRPGAVLRGSYIIRSELWVQRWLCNSCIVPRPTLCSARAIFCCKICSNLHHLPSQTYGFDTMWTWHTWLQCASSAAIGRWLRRSTNRILEHQAIWEIFYSFELQKMLLSSVSSDYAQPEPASVRQWSLI